MSSSSLPVRYRRFNATTGWSAIFKCIDISLSWITLIGFLLASLEDFPCSAYPPPWQAQATSHAGCHSARKQVSSELCPAVTITPRFWHRHIAFDTSTVVPLGSSSCLIPDPVNARPFPSALTTMALGHSRRRWFGTCSCKPVPRGLPSSDKQLRATWPHGLSRSWRTIVSKPEVSSLTTPAARCWSSS